MKKTLILLGVFVLCLGLSSQQQFDVTVTNISVPVRVYHDAQFVDNLTIADFEVLDNGVPQKVEALYLIKSTDVARKEAPADVQDPLNRHFYFLFQITEYDARITDAIDYFFKEVFLPGDQLTLMTPAKEYVLAHTAVKNKSPESLAREMQNVIRGDTSMGASNYRALVQDLQRIVRAIYVAGSFGSQTGDTSGSTTGSAAQGFQLPTLLANYRQTLEKLDQVRFVDEKKFLGFAQRLKRLNGQKHIFFFYEREYRPELSERVVNQMMSMYQDEPNILGDLQDLFQFYQRQPRFDPYRMKVYFSDASGLLHFIFMDRQVQSITGVNMREQSEDVFSTFVEVAQATGGLVNSTNNPGFALQNALKYSDTYYLLYYSPAKYVKDGQFKTIQVRLKNPDYRVLHRAGYIAN
jgi:hypothetical protein